MTVAMLMDNTMRSWMRWVARETLARPDAKDAANASSSAGTESNAPRSPAEPPVPMLFISGGPGAGKGTQANMLMARYGSQQIRGADGNDAPIAPDEQHGLVELEDGRRFTLAHISVGALLRQQMQPGPKLKLPASARDEIAQTLEKGGILAGHITVQLLRAEIERLMAEHAAATAAAAASSSSSAGSPSSPSSSSSPPRLAVLIDGFPRSADNISELERHVCALRHVLTIDVPRSVMTARLQRRGRDDDRPDVIARRMHGYEEQTLPTLRSFQQQVEAATKQPTAADTAEQKQQPQSAATAASHSQPPPPSPRFASSYSLVDGRRRQHPCSVRARGAAVVAIPAIAAGTMK